MNAAAVIGIVVALVVLAVAIFVVTARRHDSRRGEGALSRETRQRDRSGRSHEEIEVPPAPTGREIELAAVAAQSPGALEKVEPKLPAPYVPPDPETIGVTRRQFFNRGLVALTSAGLAGFGAAVVGFLWSAPKGGFGGKISVGSLEDINAGIAQNSGFYYVPEARAWITAYPAEALPQAETVYAAPVLAGMKAGINALYQKCPHLGCRVPQCATSQWFECPCHGSQYNRAGEKKAGPAPRGMDRFGVDISGGSVTLDTGLIFQGPSIGTNTTGQEAEGPHCVSGGEGGH
jgi:cytochrome b6-f complex iron-sulfur subunit